MIPEPVYIYKCPKCGVKIGCDSFGSGNTFGTKLFSDGMRISPMLTDYPSLYKCRDCNSVFWTNKEKTVGVIDYTEEKKWRKVKRAVHLNLYDYWSTLEDKNYDSKDEEIYIRQSIWRGFNDRVRRGEPLFSYDNDESIYSSNATRLMEMLDTENVNQKILIAELNRNLGNFEKCKEILASIEDIKYDWLKIAFEKECDEKNKYVFQLK